MKRIRGFSFLEMVIALSLLGLLFPLVANLIPTGLVAQKRAEDIESSNAFAAGWVKEAIQRPAIAPGVDRNQTVVLGRHSYRATRQFFLVSPQLMDVVVTLVPDSGQTVVLSTRIFLRR